MIESEFRFSSWSRRKIWFTKLNTYIYVLQETIQLLKSKNEKYKMASRDNSLKNNKDIQNLNLDKDILNLLYNRNITEKRRYKNFLDVNIKI